MRATIELVLFFGTLVAGAWFLAAWMQRVYDGRPACDHLVGTLERVRRDRAGEGLDDAA